MTLEQQSGRRRAQDTDKAEIAAVLGGWKRAMEAKDAARASSFYTEDAVIFSLAPPLRSNGVNVQALQAWLDTWRSGPAYEMREVHLVMGEQLAYCSSLTHLQGTKTSGEANDLWFRATVCLRKVSGTWKIAHEHTSVPFMMDGSFKAAVDLQP